MANVMWATYPELFAVGNCLLLENKPFNALDIEKLTAVVLWRLQLCDTGLKSNVDNRAQQYQHQGVG
jgi:hypothetical protein